MIRPHNCCEFAMKHWLLVGKFGSSGEINSLVIDPVPFRIGRRPEAALTLPRATVSGMHAELFTKDEDQLFVRDLGSTNGTFINGARITEVTEVQEGDVLQFADTAFKVSCQMEEHDSRTMSQDFCDHALARMQFEKLMAEGIVTPYFQPIVDLHAREILAFEVLGRSRLVGLETPARMFAAAADLQQEAALSDLLRIKGVEVSLQFPEATHIFLNTHPAEFVGQTSWDWVQRLRELSPLQPLTIEIHEGAVTEVESMILLRTYLQEYNIGLAFDDFGAGQPRITELAEVRPDYLKFDRQLIAGLDRADATRQRFVKRLVDAVHDIGVVPLAEGIETQGELDICLELGFPLAQGYWLGLPSPIDVYRHWKDHGASIHDSNAAHFPWSNSIVVAGRP
jgi:EAL domain-containing protein (putative c-di-GMP-specific phosphodiesterase class I)